MSQQPNILVLARSAQECAEAHTDQDLMQRAGDYMDTLELAYLQRNGGPTRSRHVLVKWALDENAWGWLHDLVLYMLYEQAYRYGTEDEDIFERLQLISYGEPYNCEPSRFVQLLPDKIQGDAVAAYRQWYTGEAEPCWTKRGPPDWWKGSEQLVLPF